jgi:hypothetical protein
MIDELERMWREAVLSRHLPEGSAEDHENP